MNAVAYEDNNNFILPERSGIHVPLCSLYYQGQEVGVWFNEDANIYCDGIIEQSSKSKYCVLPEEFMEGYIGIKGMSNWQRNEIFNAYTEGKMYFKNQEYKKLMQEILRYI